MRPTSRPRRGSAAALAAVLWAALLGGCAAGLTPAEATEQCAALAAQTARAGLSGTPTADQADDVANRLDAVLTQLRDPAVHDAAVALHSHLHGVEAALRKGDTEKAGRLTAEARADVTAAAKACGLPESRFLTG
jgi:long-subunit fatty acid transport protein